MGKLDRPGEPGARAWSVRGRSASERIGAQAVVRGLPYPDVAGHRSLHAEVSRNALAALEFEARDDLGDLTAYSKLSEFFDSISLP